MDGIRTCKSSIQSQGYVVWRGLFLDPSWYAQVTPRVVVPAAMVSETQHVKETVSTLSKNARDTWTVAIVAADLNPQNRVRLGSLTPESIDSGL